MPPKTAGFTLIEMLVSMSLFCLLTAVIFTPLIMLLNFHQYSSAQLGLVGQSRQLTGRLESEGSGASYFVLLKDYDTRTTTSSTGDTILASLSDGQSGSCLLFVYLDTSDPTKVKRLIGYYWLINTADSYGTLYRFENNYSTSSASAIYDLMPATYLKGLHTQVLHKVVYDSTIGGPFYNYYNRSILTNLLLTQIGDQHKNASFYYQFTVSPRG